MELSRKPPKPDYDDHWAAVNHITGNLWPKVSKRPDVQAFYEQMRKDGQTHAFAEMCALQQPFGLSGTDGAFLEGNCCGNQFEKNPAIGDAYAAEARKAGISTTGRVYKSGLARYPGDPRAWISDLSDVRRICEEDNLGCQGAYNRTPVRGIHDPGPEKPYSVAPDLVAQHVAEKASLLGDKSLAKDPEFKSHVAKELAGNPDHGPSEERLQDLEKKAEAGE
ncbi:MAG: hypothetical protein L0212_08620 [Acidobacteria bacterium]|nr:hypothetical protein [Acidobacteriota bacterium]